MKHAIAHRRFVRIGVLRRLAVFRQSADPLLSTPSKTLSNPALIVSYRIVHYWPGQQQTYIIKFSGSPT